MNNEFNQLVQDLKVFSTQITILTPILKFQEEPLPENSTENLNKAYNLSKIINNKILSFLNVSGYKLQTTKLLKEFETMLNKLREIEEHIQILKIKTYEYHSQSSPMKYKGGTFSQKSYSSSTFRTDSHDVQQINFVKESGTVAESDVTEKLLMPQNYSQEQLDLIEVNKQISETKQLISNLRQQQQQETKPTPPINRFEVKKTPGFFQKKKNKVFLAVLLFILLLCIVISVLLISKVI